MINKTTLGTLLLVSSTLASSTAVAVDSYFDGKDPLLCTLQRTYQCEIGAACSKVSQEEIGAARNLALDDIRVDHGAAVLAHDVPQELDPAGRHVDLACAKVGGVHPDGRGVGGVSGAHLEPGRDTGR